MRTIRRTYRIGPWRESSSRASIRWRPSTVNNLGVQLRYRWTFAPQSDFYAVYSRGGLELTEDEERGRSAAEMFRDALALRDADQFLVKVRYRF